MGDTQTTPAGGRQRSTAELLSYAHCAAVSLQRTLTAIVSVVGSAAVAPCWSHIAWRANVNPAPPMELSTLELQQLKKHAQRASKGQTVASRARQALQVFLAQHGADQVVRDQRPRNGPVVVIDLSEDEPVVQQRPARQQEAPAPQADPAVHEAPLQNLDAPTPQQLSDARDLASELGSLCYAIERVQPVVQDVIQLSGEAHDATCTPCQRIPCNGLGSSPEPATRAQASYRVSPKTARAMERANERRMMT